MNHVHEARCSRGTSLRLTQPPLHRFAELMHHKRVTMELAYKDLESPKFVPAGRRNQHASRVRYPAFICQRRRERVAAFEHYLMDPSSQIFRENYQQARLIAVEAPGNW